MLNIKVSGEVEKTRGIYELYETEVEMPNCQNNSIYGNLFARYLPKILKKQIGTFKNIRTAFIEDKEEINKTPSFYGKNIFDMNINEIIDFCCEFEFLFVDTSSSLKKAQELAALEFIKYKKIDIKDTPFYEYNSMTMTGFINFELMRDKKRTKNLFVIDESFKKEEVKHDEIKKMSIEEMLEKFSGNKKENKKEVKKENKEKDFLKDLEI